MTKRKTVYVETKEIDRKYKGDVFELLSNEVRNISNDVNSLQYDIELFDEAVKFYLEYIMKKETKKITVWINSAYSHEGYAEEIDTHILLEDWNKLTKQQREEICEDLSGDLLLNMISYGYYD